MIATIALALGLAAAQLPATAGIHQLTTEVPGVGTVLYGVSVPRGYDPATPAPLVVALHSGGQRMRYYGAAYTRLLVEPALRDLRAIIVAPDCPSASWTDPAAEKAVLTLVEQMMRSYAIDRSRVLVTGFSMGGRGTWFMASKHADLFTAAIPMAAATGDLPIDTLARHPTYVVHSRDDEVVPFAPAEKNAKELQRLGRRIRFEALVGFTHYEMGRYQDALRRAGRWITEQWAK